MELGFSVEVISRTDAIKKGLDQYFTGKPCKRGRIAPRRVSNYQCLCDLCRSADIARSTEYYGKNKPRILSYKKQWQKDNEDRIRQKRTEYYAENRERIKEKARRYREQNPEKARNSQRNSYQKNRSAYLAKARARHRANQERLAAAGPLSLRQEDLKALLSYDPDSGIFRWRQSSGSRALEGAEAGAVMRTKTGSYVVITLTVNGIQRRCLAHRLAFLYMEGSLPDFPTVEVDHIDGNGLNNAWSNLRLVDHRTNACNQKLRVTNSSGVNGVSWDRSMGKWEVYVWDHGCKRHLAYTDDIEEAAVLREQADCDFGYHENHGRRT